MSDAAPTLQDSQGERPFLRLISVGVVATHGTWWGLKMKVSFIGAGVMGQAIARGAAQGDATNGIGKPERLKHGFQGYWSRRISDEHRLVYKVVGDEVRIAACRYHYED